MFSFAPLRRQGILLLTLFSLFSVNARAAVHYDPKFVREDCPLKLRPLVEEDRVLVQRTEAQSKKIEELIRERNLPEKPRNEIESLPQEVSEAGRFVSSPKQLQNLPDGLYLFVIDQKGRLFFSPRLVAYDPGAPFLASHRSIENYMKRVLGTDEDLLFLGGEFEIAGGNHLATSVNNKSGSRHTDAVHLEADNDILKLSGLPETEATRLLDAGKKQIAKAHFEEVKEYGSYLRLSQNSETAPLLSEWLKLSEKMTKKFPSKEIGKWDSSEFLDEHITELVGNPELLDFFQVYGNRIQDVRERFGRLAEYIEIHGIDKAQKMIRWFEKAVN